MKAAAWKKRIKTACETIGTYEPAYDEVIMTLSRILEKRDDCDRLYQEEGSMPVTEHTNKGGGTYMERNPLLRTWMDLNAQALAYWRDLGLTPAGFKRLSDGIKAPQKTGLELALEKLSSAE